MFPYSFYLLLEIIFNLREHLQNDVGIFTYIGFCFGRFLLESC